MRIAVGAVSTLLAILVSILPLVSARSAAEDFLERMKKAAEQLEQQQRQRTQPLTQPQSQPSPSPQVATSQSAVQAMPTSMWLNNCCTPEATAKMAVSAGVADIAGIKLGMTGEQGMAALKAANPKLKIDPVRTERWDLWAGVTQDTSADPSKQLIVGLQATEQVSGNVIPETFNVGLTTHPNQPFVYMVSRNITFREGSMPTADNVMTGLRKKYGQESYPSPPATAEGFPDLRWVFDMKGQLIGGPLGKTIATSCGIRSESPMMPELGATNQNLKKMGTGNTLLNQPSFMFREDSTNTPMHCEDWIVLRVSLIKPIVTSPLVSGMTATLWHVPLYVSGLNATYAWTDQARQALADKKLKEAEKVNMPKF